MLFVVGFTFSVESVPETFEHQWDDWIGESTDARDWRTSPFYKHFPTLKGALGLI